MHGDFIKARALLDLGSQLSIVRSDLVTMLGLKRHKCDLTLSGIGGMRSESNLYFTVLQFKIERYNVLLSVSAVILKSPSNYLSHNLRHLHQINNNKIVISDDGYFGNSRVDIIFGCDVLGEILECDKIKFDSGGPYAINTIFNYAVFGPSNLLHNELTDNEVNKYCGVTLIDAVERFWRTEEKPQIKFKDPSDIECETFFFVELRHAV